MRTQGYAITVKLFIPAPKNDFRAQSAAASLADAMALTPVNLTARQRELLKDFEETFEGEEGARHSPRSTGFLDGVKSFWDRMTS